jgi:hypothetical protein
MFLGIRRRGAVLNQAAHHLFGVAGVDRGASRARGAEGEPAELQAGGGGVGAALDEVQRKAAHVLVGFVLQNLEPVDDGAHRRNHVMADPRAEQGGEVEGIERKNGHRQIHHQARGLRATGRSGRRITSRRPRRPG